MHVSGERHYYEVRPKAFHIHLVCTSCRGVEEPGGRFWETRSAASARERLHARRRPPRDVRTVRGVPWKARAPILMRLTPGQ